MAAVSNNTTVVMGGYAPPPTTTVIVQNNRSDNACRAAIPAMHIGMAVFCLIINIFLPGWGTIFAGFSVFCCANKGQSAGGKVGTLCINFWVGLLQMGTVWFFFLGWIWSIMWGAAFLGMSEDYHREESSTTIVTTQAAPAPMPMVINTSSTTAAPPPPQQYPPPQQQYPPPQQQQYPPPQQQQYPPPPAYSGQPGTAAGVPGQVQEQKF